jgi:hypothetical protein
MQIKTALKLYLTPIRRTIINTTSNAGKDAGENAPSCTVYGNVN